MNESEVCWPEGWKRTGIRFPSRFKKRSLRDSYHALLGETDRWHARRLVITARVLWRSDDNSPRRQQNKTWQKADPGVAIYFDRRYGSTWRRMTLVCDRYPTVSENMYALARTVSALRQIERDGAGQVLERVESSLAALPASLKQWRDTLGFTGRTREQLRSHWRGLMSKHHPDRGGSHDRWVELQAAYEEGCRALA